jgi:hypothetical protein
MNILFRLRTLHLPTQYLYMTTVLVDLARFFSFLICTQSVDFVDVGSDRCKAATYTQNNTKQNKRTQISMPGVGFELTIPVFELARTVHALDRAANVISPHTLYLALYMILLLLLLFIIWFLRLLALRPLLAYCASLG